MAAQYGLSCTLKTLQGIDTASTPWCLPTCSLCPEHLTRKDLGLLMASCRQPLLGGDGGAAHVNCLQM